MLFFKTLLLFSLLWVKDVICNGDPPNDLREHHQFFSEKILDQLKEKSQSQTNNILYRSVIIKRTNERDNEVFVNSIVHIDCNPNENCRPLLCNASFVRGESDNTYSIITNSVNCVPVEQYYCAGCPFDLNINVSGITTFTDAAIAHCHTEQNTQFVQVLRFQRQVLETVPKGVKYFLLIETVQNPCDANCEDNTNIPNTCYIVFLEKPTLDNQRHIVSNNCTDNQEYTFEIPDVIPRRNDQSNEIDVNYSISKIKDVSSDQNNNRHEKQPLPSLTPAEYDQIAQTGSADDMAKLANPEQPIYASHIQEIESQIIPAKQTQLNSDKKQAIAGLMDIFDFDVEPKFSKQNTESLNAANKDRLSPIIEPLIVPVKAIVSFHKHAYSAPKIETVVIGIADSDSICDTPNTTEVIKSEDTVVSRSKRSINSKQLHPTVSDEQVLIENLSELAVNELDNIDTDNRKRVVLKILSSKKQYSEGIIYHLTLKVGISECMENMIQRDIPSNLLESMREKTPLEEKCQETLLPDLTMICKVQIYVTEKISNPKVVKSQCQNLKRNGELSNRTGGGSRYSRGTLKEKKLLGAPIEFNETDPVVRKIGDISLRKLDELSEAQHRLKVARFLHGERQLVAGMLYKMEAEIGLSKLLKDGEVDYETRQNAELHENPEVQRCLITMWETISNGTKVNIECDTHKVEFWTEQSKLRNRRSVLTGAPVPLDIDDPIVREMTTVALDKLDTASEETNRVKINKIISAKKQIVSGILYKINVEIGLSDLSKTDEATFEKRLNANLLSEPKLRRCQISMWDQPWMNSDREIGINCDDNVTFKFRSRRDILRNHMKEEKHLKHFTDFLAKYNKTYTRLEYKKRFNIFKMNMKIIQELNDNEHGTAKYGPTMFADMTRKEFEQYLGYNPNLSSENNVPHPMATIPDISIPDSFDWRDKGAVSEVKNQKQCGSCWAFSVTGNIEGQYAIKKGKLLEFSEQELVDCDKTDDGCGGGLMDNAYRQIEKLGGLETESDYPYEARNDKCHLDTSKIRVQLKGAVNITQDETGMAKWLVANGPISIAINANAMQFYMGGISHPWKALCSPKQLDHGVLIVGYGVHTNKYFNKTMPYWIVKNSWGPRWGEKGYYRVYRGAGTCGLNQTPSSAILSDDV